MLALALLGLSLVDSVSSSMVLLVTEFLSMMFLAIEFLPMDSLPASRSRSLARAMLPLRSISTCSTSREAAILPLRGMSTW